MVEHYKMLIGGKWVDARRGGLIEVINPATEEVIATVPAAEKEDVEEAILAAHKAFPKWSKETPFYRGELLRKAAQIVIERSKEIAKIMTQEQGKTLKESQQEVEKGAAILRYYAEEGERIYGRVIANEEKNTESIVLYEPIGVAAAITPWNYPIELLAWKIGGALAAGCTLVAKIPSETPLSPLKFVECLVEAGLPEGVLNAVTGSGKTIGPLLVQHPLVKRVAFTGSTETGKEILKYSASGIKKVTLELGGSLPMIVYKDANLDAAVAGAVRRSFRNAGQICIAVNRIYVHNEIYENFLEKFKEETEKIVIGNNLVEKCDMGPMCTRSGLEKVELHVKDAVSKGAKVVCGGKRPEGKKFEKGFFFEPTIVRDVNHSMLIMQEETFGPAVGVMPFRDIDEAIFLANDTNYGLAAIVYTNDLNVAKRFAQEIKAGNIAINNVDAGVINAPYGGWNDSGIGVEHGPEGLYEYLHQKHVRIHYFI
ncbi:aldehyde dehydrogenase family protein [Thermosediminibacter litoriperuensis]|uniref:3-sulfolactaldehyde dehydrogenase n=1 Tax=Thermosediminibacter litoriperuensis TaxID=291989 RepID=A0A5S5AWX0_9FIRM|nr:NAD-dependent succinate-semialdehyde dehydrogenase [Thermosediminibacter litoriperuensis]TYP57851.1 succinate-semialdehyde dehydrogenase/glutarate-semialdehyde dehydrogenase [Thermosediminibacter litoriperuensis]